MFNLSDRPPKTTRRPSGVTATAYNLAASEWRTRCLPDTTFQRMRRSSVDAETRYFPSGIQATWRTMLVCARRTCTSRTPGGRGVVARSGGCGAAALWGFRRSGEACWACVLEVDRFLAMGADRDWIHDDRS